jgi:hypothetical protein
MSDSDLPKEGNALSNEQITGAPVDIGSATALTEEDLAITNSVDRYLASGLALKQWWDETYPVNGFANRFPLERTFNQPDSSFGFFDQVLLDHKSLPIMGNFQNMFYDQPRTPTAFEAQAAEWMRDQIREFVLRYFMRVSSFCQPEACADPDRPVPPLALRRLSWCTEPTIQRQGFGFTQLYYKLRDGQIGKFPSRIESAIVDLHDIGQKYEWIVVKVRIFDFAFSFKPFGPDTVELSLPLDEWSYLVLSPDFILDDDNPGPGLIGAYGLGYAFIKNPTTGLIAYGPGEFDAAFELINFRVRENGVVCVDMVFVANRPERITNITLDPVDWSLKFADMFSFGLTSRLLSPVRGVLDGLPTGLGSFDPVYSYVALANALSGGRAAQDLCISREKLDKDFLVQHFMQHYTTIVGSLLTWRQVPNWLNSAALPEWIITGRSS